VVGLLFLGVLVSAQRPTKRQFTVKTDKDNLDIKAVSGDADFKDEFHFVLRTFKDSQHIFNSNFQYNSKVGKNQTQMHIQFQLGQVVEFPSASPDVVYDVTSNPVSTWPNKGTPRQWTDWQGQTSVDNGVIIRQWERTDGVITVRCLIADAYVPNSPLQVGPNHVKIDIDINNYPYQNPNNTRLGLYTWLESQTKIKSHEKGQHKFVFDDDTGYPLGLIDWVPEVIINNLTSIPVVALPYENGNGPSNNWEIYYTIVTAQNDIHPKYITWDPSIGLAYDTPPPPEFCVFTTVCGVNAYVTLAGIGVGALLIVATIVGVVLKRRNGYTAINGEQQFL